VLVLRTGDVIKSSHLNVAMFEFALGLTKPVLGRSACLPISLVSLKSTANLDLHPLQIPHC